MNHLTHIIGKYTGKVLKPSLKQELDNKGEFSYKVNPGFNDSQRFSKNISQEFLSKKTLTGDYVVNTIEHIIEKFSPLDAPHTNSEQKILIQKKTYTSIVKTYHPSSWLKSISREVIISKLYSNEKNNPSHELSATFEIKKYHPEKLRPHFHKKP